MDDLNQAALKTCTRCKLDKPKSDFYKLRNDVSSYCKSCNHEYRIQKTRENRTKAIELLGGKCVKCGYNKCIAALHFHHPDPSLKVSISDFRHLRNRKWETIKKTLLEQKCVLLCANCHTEEHWNDE